MIASWQQRQFRFQNDRPTLSRFARLRLRRARLKSLTDPGFSIAPVSGLPMRERTLRSLLIPCVDQGIGALLGDVPVVADAIPEPRPLSLIDPLASQVHDGKGT